MRKIHIGILVGAIAILNILIWGFIFTLHTLSEYYVEGYKPVETIKEGNIEKLRERFTEIDYQDYTLCIEWFTYDNEVINKAPYKLFVVVVPKDKNLKSVFVESVSIDSSLNTKYEINSVKNWPVQIYSRQDNLLNRQSFTFDDKFNFKFEEKEEIHLVLKIKAVSDYTEKTETIDMKFQPIKVKHFAPIV